MDPSYVETVRLLLETAPAVFRSERFAMKGGTALNLFVRNMPRLSVDIDVVYVNHALDRDAALEEISSELEAARTRLEKLGIDAEKPKTMAGEEVKLFVRRSKATVKIEVNFVFRGTVMPVETRQLATGARDLFTTELSLPVLAEAELYGSKLVAALDRQHPRDLFDVRGMYEHTGLTREIVDCFVCYLSGHNRPVHEVLFSKDRDIEEVYESEFQGMTLESVPLEELLGARERLRKDLSAALTGNHRKFLLSLVSGKPEWRLMSCQHLDKMPAVRWKLLNLSKLEQMNRRKFLFQADELRRRFEG